MAKFAFRYILKQKKTTFSIIIGIVLTVVMMFSLMQMGDSIAVRYESLLIKGQQYDFSMRHMTAAKQAELASGLRTGLYGDESYLILNESLNAKLPSNGMEMSIIGSDGDVASVFGFELTEGAFPSKSYEICVEERINTYSDHEYRVGESITLPVTCGDVTDAVAETFFISGFIKDLPTGSSFLVINTTLDTAEEISQKHVYDNNDARSIFVTVEKEKYDADTVYKTMNAMGYGDPYGDLSIKFEVNDAKIQAYDQSVGDSYVNLALKVLAIVLSSASVFLIYNSINLSVAEKIRQYGTFRCLGMKRSQLAHMLLIEVLIYSILGIGIGLALGILLNMCLAQSIMSMILGSNVLLAQRPVTYLSVFCLAIAVIGVSTFFSIHKLLKLTPVQAMKYTEAEHYKFQTFSKKNSEEKIPKKNIFILHLAGRNLSRNRGKTMITFLSIFISALLCMVIGNFFSCIDPGESVGMNQKLAQYQLYISDGSGDRHISTELLEGVRGLDGVNTVYAIGSNSFTDSHTMNIDGIYFSESMLVVLDDTLIQEISERYHLDLDGEIALFYETGDEKVFDFPPDSVVVVEGNSADPDTQFTLTQIEDSPYNLLSGYRGSGILFVNEKLADRVFGEYEYTDLLIDSNLAYEELRLQITKLNGMTDPIQLADIEAGSEEALKELAGIFLIAIFVIVFTALLSVLNISNTVRSNIQLRQSENGMLRAIGMTSKTLTWITYTENALIGLLASGLASVFGILAAALIFPQIDSKFHPIIWIYPIVIAAVVLTCILTSYYPMRAHRKTTIRTHIDE